MSNVISNRSTHAGQLERWAGKERLEQLSASMRGWYGKPLAIIDVPGTVKVGGDGDFHGIITRGRFLSALDDLELRIKSALRVPRYGLAAGFTSVGDALARASSGFGQVRSFQKAGSTGVVAVTSSLWRVGNQPGSGAAPGNAPGGTAFSSSSTGAINFANPAAGTNRLVGADISASQLGSLLIYDLIFGCDKTMNSTATEAVTGVPSRYQSATDTDEDAAAGNFLFVQVGGTALPATAHNWTTCTYTDQSNNAGVTLPSITGNSSAIVDRLDHPASHWFAPLATGDYGIKALTQMQCSAAVATGVVWFMMGHPLGVCLLPVVNYVLPFDWITNRNQAPRVFDNACLALLEMTRPGVVGCAYTGNLYTTSTSS